MAAKYSKEQQQIIVDIKKFISTTNSFPSKHELQKSKGFSCGYEKAYTMFGGTGPLKKACDWLDWKSASSNEDFIKLYESKGSLNNGCLEWPSLDIRKEYGVVQKNNKQYKIHRLIWELYNNQEIPANKIIMHMCNNKKCYNIKHLQIGTISENTKAAIVDKLFDPLKNLQNKKLFSSIEEAVLYYQSIAIVHNTCLILDKEYPSLYVKNKKYLIHRVIVSIKENLNYSSTDWVARHLCNNKQCIKNEHLVSGTKSDNAKDSIEFKKTTKLSEDDVRNILKQFLLYSNKLLKDFDLKHAEHYRVSTNTIKSVRLGNTWKHIYKEFFNETN